MIKVTGRVQFELLREDGSQITWESENLVHTMGKGLIASRMQAAPPATAVMNAMAVGSGNVAPGAGDQTLQAEIARVALANAVVAAAVVTYTATFPPGTGTGALQEAGLFNAVGAGSLPGLARTTFAVINKAAGDTLNVTWTVTIG